MRRKRRGRPRGLEPGGLAEAPRPCLRHAAYRGGPFEGSLYVCRSSVLSKRPRFHQHRVATPDQGVPESPGGAVPMHSSGGHRPI